MWFFIKLLTITCVFIWIRGTLPRLRMDQLMHFAWRFMLPMALLNIFAAAAWKFFPSGAIRWFGCALFLAAAFVLLVRGLKRGGDVHARQYRFAE
jgi:NADH-quinone oxidoreductase subunit H